MTLPVRICTSCRYRATDVALASDAAATRWLCSDCPMLPKQDSLQRELLRRRLAESVCETGSTTVWAKRYGVSPVHLFYALRGQRGIGPKTMRALVKAEAASP